MPSHDDFPRRVLIAVGITLSLLVSLFLLWHASRLFLMAFGSVLLALFLRGLAEMLSEHTPLTPGPALAVVVLLLLAIIGGGGWLIGPQLAGQVDQLSEQLPQSLDRASERLREYEWGARLIERAPSPTEVVSPGGSGFLSSVTGIFSQTLNALTDLALVIGVGIYLAVDPRLYRNGLVRLVPPAHRERARAVLREVGHTLRHWIVGQAISMLIIGALITVGLLLLGMPLALTLGLLAGLLEYIPTIGPYLGAIPAILLALTISPTQALYVTLLYVGVQLLESNVINPLVQQEAVSVPPALLLVSLAFFGTLFGPLGLLFAVPLTAALRVIVRMLYIEDVLGDPVERESEPATS